MDLVEMQKLRVEFYEVVLAMLSPRMDGYRVIEDLKNLETALLIKMQGGQP